MGMPPNVFKGNFEGATLRMTCRGPEGFHRATWELPASGAYRYRVEMPQDGQQWQPFMEGDYLRTG